MKKKSDLLLIGYWLLFLAFSLYCYVFLDVGLTLTSFKPYLQFQKQMRYFGNSNRPLSTILFLVLSCFLFVVYYLLIKSFKKKKVLLTRVLLFSFLIAGVLILAYPAFSHDIFNYIFNAKMVLVYQADPHYQTANQFADPMVDFMRNVHTPAPYFYGWTLISLIPYFFSFQRIFLSLINFKLLAGFFYFFTFAVLKKVIKKLNLPQLNLRLALFLLNPLILIEAIAVGHNDLAMMMPALLSFYYLFKFKKRRKMADLLFSIFLFASSVSIKYATIALLPLFVIWFFKPKLDLGFWGAVVLFLLPFSRPLDQLHSWYFIWPLSWAFLSKNIKVIYFACFVSFFSLLRYAPYIWQGNWDPPVHFLRLVIYFALPLVSLPYFILVSQNKKK